MRSLLCPKLRALLHHGMKRILASVHLILKERGCASAFAKCARSSVHATRRATIAMIVARMAVASFGCATLFDANTWATRTLAGTCGIRFGSMAPRFQTKPQGRFADASPEINNKINNQKIKRTIHRQTSKQNKIQRSTSTKRSLMSWESKLQCASVSLFIFSSHAD